MRILSVACLMAIAMVGAAFALDVHWTNTAVSSGDFNTESNFDIPMAGTTNKINWFGFSGPPASLNIYSLTLNLSDNLAIGGWDQDYWNNEVNVNLNGFTLDQSGAGDPEWGVWTYGASSIGVTNRIYGGGKLNAMALRVGGAGATATSPLFEIYGAGTRVTTGTGAGYFGNNTRAFIRDGAVLSNDTSWATVHIGQGGSSTNAAKNAVVTLTDSGSRWDNNGLLVVGYVKGDGTLIVTNGAVYKGGNRVNLGGWQYLYNPIEDYKNKGTIRVTGSGSKFTTVGQTDVGLLSTGRVEVLKGGEFTAPNMRLGVGYSDWKPGNVSNFDGTNTAAYGSVLADDLGVLIVNGDMTVGVLGKGDVMASNNGEIYVGGNLDVNTDGQVTVSDGYINASSSEMSGSLLRLELGAKALTAYYLEVGGSLTLTDVDLQLALLGNFSAGLGDTVNLISYGDLTGSFNGWTDGQAVVLDEYEFTYNQGSTDASLTVTAIPEPASVLLMLSGILGAYKLRRRA
jgi:T5SS/PEP-CTERM-associated repeat protein